MQMQSERLQEYIDRMSRDLVRDYSIPAEMYENQDIKRGLRNNDGTGVLETLPQKLQETARLRRENPEATLSELAEMPDPPVSKSAVNHRMRKLMELSKTL